MPRFENTIETNSYLNATKIRTHNKRITTAFGKKENGDDIINVSFQAILPESELNFKGNYIRMNMKNTEFGLTMESAHLLCKSLMKTLEKYHKSKENEKEI